MRYSSPKDGRDSFFTFLQHSREEIDIIKKHPDDYWHCQRTLSLEQKNLLYMRSTFFWSAIIPVCKWIVLNIKNLSKYPDWSTNFIRSWSTDIRSASVVFASKSIRKSSGLVVDKDLELILGFILDRIMYTIYFNFIRNTEFKIVEEKGKSSRTVVFRSAINMLCGNDEKTALENE